MLEQAAGAPRDKLVTAASFTNAAYMHIQGLPGGTSAKLQACTGGSTDPDCTPGERDVPEPASMALLGLGLIGAGVVSRRKQ